MSSDSVAWMVASTDQPVESLTVPWSSSRRDALLKRMERETAASAYYAREGEPSGWLTAITNQVAVGDRVDEALDHVLALAGEIGRLNPGVMLRLIVGWWSDGGLLFIDVGLECRSAVEALAVAAAFAQRAVALKRGAEVTIVGVAA